MIGKSPNQNEAELATIRILIFYNSPVASHYEISPSEFLKKYYLVNRKCNLTFAPIRWIQSLYVMEIPYIHDTSIHNLLAPGKLVPIFIDMFNPSCVVDFGCGTGTFLNVFQKYGIKDVLGLDGEWVDRSLLHQNIDESYFREVDLNSPIILEKKYDLAICLEVAEHLMPENADIIVHSLTQASDIIVFSAAIPGQGGPNHFNEQWPDYWAKKFRTERFCTLDLLRASIWDDNDINWWYRQNIFIVVKNGLSLNIQQKFEAFDYRKKTLNFVHPELFNRVFNKGVSIQSRYNSVVSGELHIKTYIHYLLRAVKRHINRIGTF